MAVWKVRRVVVVSGRGSMKTAEWESSGLSSEVSEMDGDVGYARNVAA